MDVEDGEINDPASATKALFSSTNPFIMNDGEAKSDHRITAIADSEKVDKSGKVTDPETPAPIKQSSVPDKPLPPPQTSKQPELPSKPETKMPASVSSVPPRPPRPDSARNSSDLAIGGRPSHSLPTRPDPLPGPSRIGEQRVGERIGDRTSRDGRDSRFPDGSRRSERATESIRDQVPDRHGLYRTHDRPPERPTHNDRERQDVIWGGDRPVPSRLAPDERYNMYPRDPRPLFHDERIDRSARERQHMDSYENLRSDVSGHRSRDSSMPPPRSNLGPHPDRAGLVHSALDSDRSHGGTYPERRGEVPRLDDDAHQDPQRGSRTASPNRRDERSSRPSHHHRDDRPTSDNRRLFEETSSIRPRYEDSRPPTGPRTERHVDLPQNSAGDKFRDSFRQSNATAPPDSNLGRLNQDSSNLRHQESQYGRLNTIDPPSGPRLVHGNQAASSRGPRGVAIQNPQVNTQALPTSSTLQSSTISEKQTPTGPASGRLPPRNSASFNRPPPISTSAPPAPSTDSPDTAGVHPDRLKAINFATEVAPEYMPPLVIPTAASTVSVAPAGPRASSNAQTSSPTTGNRPTAGAPSFANNERARGDKRFTNLNNVLQQAGGTTGPDRSNQGASIRGRSTRANNLPAPPISSMSSRKEPLLNSETFPSPHQELFSNHSASGPNLPQRESDATHTHAPLRDGDRRSNRRREGRSQSPRRHSGVNPMIPVATNHRDDPRPIRRMDEQREHRSRPGGPPLMNERERRGPRDDGAIPGLKDRDRRDGDRREDWAGDRMGQDRRDRERREPVDFAGNGRKRPRGVEDAYEMGKRPRRTQ